ncbi:MAG: hypothetical protein HY673_00025 [Chloroflexi bacterium]|nr:hypothetical protein [Chloroflexota bacterium]
MTSHVTNGGRESVRHDREAEDGVYIPPYLMHQHFNRDVHHPARFAAFQSDGTTSSVTEAQTIWKMSNLG